LTPSPPVSEEEQTFLRALRKLVEAVGTPPKKEAPKLTITSIVFLGILALDVSAGYRMFARLFENTLPKYAWELMPTFLGTAFVAYVDRLRRALMRHIDSAGFRLSILTAFPALVIPQVVSYAVPLHVREGAYLWVDDTPADEGVGDTIRVLHLSGFRDHSIRIAEYYVGEKRHEDTVTLGRWSMVHASLGQLPILRSLRSPDPLELDTRMPVTIDLPNKGITYLVIRGYLPLLYQRSDASQRWAVSRLPTGENEIRILIEGGTMNPEILLPPSVRPYSVSYVHSGCRPPEESVLVEWGKPPANVSLTSCQTH
jgi:hypothetical protein